MQGKTANQVLDNMTSEEASELIAFLRTHPLPDHWWMFGNIATLMVNLWSKTKTKPEDWIPVARRRQTAKEMKGKLDLIAKGLKGATRRP